MTFTKVEHSHTQKWIGISLQEEMEVTWGHRDPCLCSPSFSAIFRGSVRCPKFPTTNALNATGKESENFNKDLIFLGSSYLALVSPLISKSEPRRWGMWLLGSGLRLYTYSLHGNHFTQSSLAVDLGRNVHQTQIRICSRNRTLGKKY